MISRKSIESISKKLEAQIWALSLASLCDLDKCI
jgi:hypothetical protein